MLQEFPTAKIGVELRKIQPMEKFFNTAGPVNPEDHYCLDPMSRIKFKEIENLIEQKKYFILHAPRQTGKTSTLLALRDYLNESGKYSCSYVNVEAGQAYREHIDRAMAVICDELLHQLAVDTGVSFSRKEIEKAIGSSAGGRSFNAMLRLWAAQSSRPCILFIDEVDSLIGDTLISLLRQLRSGYTGRPKQFPQSIVLCGVRDVRDYRICSSRSKEIITGGSAFNIKAKSFLMSNFTSEEVASLIGQHTQETGQQFDPRAVELIWDLTRGQPWLVNALAYEVTFEMQEDRDSGHEITTPMVEQAKENIIQRRDTHIDQLVDKLKESRIRHVLEPMLSGEELSNKVSWDDRQYAIDLGLICESERGLIVSNPIYAEIVPRELTWLAQDNLNSTINRLWYIDPQSGALVIEKLLSAFQAFFRENAEIWLERFDYKEAGPQLLLQAFLQRIINSGGQIIREYGLGKLRTDLLIKWPDKSGKIQKEIMELKIADIRRPPQKAIAQGLQQTKEYMDRCGVDHGHLLIFDRREGISWQEKIFKRDEKVDEKRISIWGM